MGINTEKIVKVTRDILGMSAGFAGIMIQVWKGQFDPIALLVCALLLGVPLANLKAISNAGESTTQEPSSPSPRSPQSEPSTPPLLPPSSNASNGS